MGGGEESGTGADGRCGKADERGRNGEPESKEATATKDEETDTEVGSTASGRDEAKHALRPVEGHETSMHTTDGPHRATGDDGRITPSRSEYEEESGDEETLVRTSGYMGHIRKIKRKILLAGHVQEPARLRIYMRKLSDALGRPPPRRATPNLPSSSALQMDGPPGYDADERRAEAVPGAG